MKSTPHPMLAVIIVIIASILVLSQCTPKIKESVSAIFMNDKVQQSCILTSSQFATWFNSGSVAKDGLVNSANSLQELNNPCDFYKWSWQMFLWQLSPMDGSYVFDSAPFFDLEGDQLVRDGVRHSVRGGKVEREGQAGLVSGVLMSQKAGITPEGSIVYYAIHVNDVYAYFASGKNSGGLTTLNEFPITQAQLDEIINYAKNTYGVEITDGESLTMELKSSWIKATPEMDRSQYISIVADIPKYVKTSDKLWTWDGSSFERQVTLVLVGYHVVGSTANHPEMVWATFEHNNNATDVDYYYVDKNGKVQEETTIGSDGKPIKKDWAFTDGNTTVNASNQMHMELKSRDIVAMSQFTISPSSTVRTHPWGNTPDPENAKNNTDIISLNNNIQSLLSEGDQRRNYFLVGATWTANGVPGVGDQLPDVKGSKVLANATMETYFQYKSCFGCHKDGKLDGLSHIFTEIKPLAR